jgi:hypothetical protein
MEKPGNRYKELENAGKYGKTVFMASTVSDVYFQRFGWCEREIASPPARDLGMAVVIPCFNEPDLIGSLESLWACERPACAVEVIVVINAAADSGEDVRLQNQKTLDATKQWTVGHTDARLRFYPLYFPDLPPKRAGVGLARKIGMDEAIRRFEDVNRPGGIVACYDADCRCAPNYLKCLERHFAEHPRTPGCSIYFEHPLDGPLSSAVYEAVAAYELHLRYYVQALRHVGFPFAHHTIGSCMAVRADAYKNQGGMNKRQAGEDFYFLQKVIPLGGFTDLTQTTVFPSPRSSDRVPFGSGRAVRDLLNGDRKPATYPLEAFIDLGVLFHELPEIYRDGTIADTCRGGGWPESLRIFLPSQGFGEAVREIRGNTSSEMAFRKRFFQWFNGLRVMKFVHHARDRCYGEREVSGEAGKLLARLRADEPNQGPGSVRVLLDIYRGLDKVSVAIRSER